MRLSNKGFTLVELLVVTTLLSLLMLVGTYSYSLFTNKWQDELGHFKESNEQAVNFHRLFRVLSNIQPYVVIKNNKEPGFLFIGASDSLLAVTHDSIFSPNTNEVFLLSKVRSEDGNVNLVYQAKSLESASVITSKEEIAFEKEITLLSGFTDISFSYYSWPSFNAKGDRRSITPITRAWTSSFSGIDNQLTPETIKVTAR